MLELAADIVRPREAVRKASRLDAQHLRLQKYSI